jgi:HSP20 family molecular chaperone IbpA
MFPWNFFPFNKDMQSKLQQMRPEEMNQFVQSMMSKMFHPSSPHTMNMNPEEFTGGGFHPFQSSQEHASTNTKLQYTLFETHEDIFVRVVIESEDWLKSIKLTHTSNLLILEHIPNDEDCHKIPLPSLVKKKGTTAFYKDGMLEIKIPKNIDLQYSEVDITEIL